MARVLLRANRMRLVDVLVHASLVAVSACECPDGRVDTSAFATRKSYAREIDACIASDASCEALCRAVLELEPAIAITTCVITSASAEGAALDVTYVEPIDCGGAGRRPHGFRSAPRRLAGAGPYIAHIAALEAASVTAFARLARALAHEAIAAPRALVAAAREAIADELAHAALTAQLARRFGAEVRAPDIVPAPASPAPPTLDALALDNAVEGQVGETFGALIATCQSRSARDPHVRAVLAQIASDEARHAALAHQLARWLDARLGLQARNAVARARQVAIDRVLASCDFGLAPAERELLGIPPPTRLRAAAEQLFAMV